MQGLILRGRSRIQDTQGSIRKDTTYSYSLLVISNRELSNSHTQTCRHMMYSRASLEHAAGVARRSPVQLIAGVYVCEQLQ
jgi:hypothetical protein